MLSSKEEDRLLELMILGCYRHDKNLTYIHDLFFMLYPYTKAVIESVLARYSGSIDIPSMRKELIGQSYIVLVDAADKYDYNNNNNFHKYYGLRLFHDLCDYLNVETGHRQVWGGKDGKKGQVRYFTVEYEDELHAGDAVGGLDPKFRIEFKNDLQKVIFFFRVVSRHKAGQREIADFLGTSQTLVSQVESSLKDCIKHG